MKDSQFMEDILKYMVAENKAFKEKDIEIGRVEFVCPVCGGKAIGNRYKHNGRIHGLGSGCTKCGIRHS